MPNQYTKLKDARKKAIPIDFKFREYTASNKSNNQKRSKARCARQHDDVLSLSNYSVSGGLRIDPFNASTVKPGREELALLDHFLYIVSPGKSRADRVNPHLNLLLPYVMREEALFDALLASCQASLAISSGLSVHHDRSFVAHRGRAISYLRKKVMTGIDRNAMVIVSLLLMCDHMTGDIDAVTNHTKALFHMSKICGQDSENPLDQFVRSGVLALQAVSSMVTGHVGKHGSTWLDDVVDPSEDLVYLQPPFAPDVSERAAKLPQGFCELVLSCQLSTQLCAILEEINKLNCSQLDTLHQNVDVTSSIQAAIQRFSQHTSATYLERCIAAGLWCWTNQHPRLQTPNLFHDSVLQGFSRLFLVAYKPGSIAEREVIVWAHVCMQGFASLRATILPGTRQAFRHAIDSFGVMSDWYKLRPVLERFYHTDESLERWKKSYAAFVRYSLSSETSTTCPHSNGTSENDTSPDTPASGSTSRSTCPVTGLHLRPS